MQRLRAVAVLLLVAAWAPAVWAGSAADPELTDAAGDQAVTAPVDVPDGVPEQVPVVPGVNDDPFDDVDLVAAWFEERTIDCVGSQPLTCPQLTLVVQTTAAWSGGTLAVSFRTQRGPTSYATSNATGQQVNITVTGTAVTGLANATAAVGPEGLRIQMPMPRLGLVGGDEVTNLTLTATRTNSGTITDPMVTQDDRVGSDEAGPGSTYTMVRPTPVQRWHVRVVSVDGNPGTTLTLTERRTVPIVVEVTNLGTDRDAYVLNDRTEGETLPNYRGFADSDELDPLQSARHSINVSMEGMSPGSARILFFVDSPQPLATAILVYAPAAAEREVVPAGLDFLTPAAESMGLDDAFGKYAEAVLLGLLVLLAILAVFLATALARSTLAGAGDPASPPLASPEGAPAKALPAAPVVPPADPAAATVGGALAIESVTHDPDAPEEGQEIATEVVLRNPGPTRQVRVVLARDGIDLDDKAVLLPARATKTVRLAWTAGPGQNNVNVRVLPA